MAGSIVEKILFFFQKGESGGRGGAERVEEEAEGERERKWLASRIP